MLPLLRATHLGPSLAVTAMTCALALAAGVGSRVVLMAVAVLAGQFTVGWGNDWADRHRDRAAGRTDKPIATGEVGARTVAVAWVIALAVCVVASLALGPVPGLLHLAAVAAGLSYDAGLKRTLLSPLPYVVAFGLLPVFVAAVAGGGAPGWAVLAAACLGAGAHLTNALPDLDIDRRTGVRALPHRLGPRGAALGGALLLGLGALAAALGPGIDALRPLGLAALGFCAVLVAGVLVVGLAAATRLAFTLSMAAAGTVVVLLVSAGPVLG
jgi:4-hydroxybenzoate polyprenyltransferase